MSVAGSSGGLAALPADAQAARLCVGVSGGLAAFAFLVSKMTAAVRRNPMTNTARANSAIMRIGIGGASTNIFESKVPEHGDHGHGLGGRMNERHIAAFSNKGRVPARLRGCRGRETC